MSDIPRLAGLVDAYFEEALSLRDDALEGALRRSAEAGLPPINVSACQGKLLELLALTAGARSVLEVGTLGGFSTIFLARAARAAGGRVLSLELKEAHAAVARMNLADAGVAELVEVRVGPALESMMALGPADGAPFDFVFIDADKQTTAEYFDRALELSRPGTLIVVDNVGREGAVADAASTDPSVLGIRRFVERLRGNPRVAATAIQTIGAKSHDGFALVRVLS
ncbi:MAG: class I SAM-dependent methyltransferase [Candidatus Sumerlaeia bacterium]|nr:class I SAM-dependent methyltransferase [Candidatus Sumerlaeia bacterium]